VTQAVPQLAWEDFHPGRTFEHGPRVLPRDTRASNSRPEMGFVRFNFELFNAAGEPVMTLTTSLMLGRRRT